MLEKQKLLPIRMFFNIFHKVPKLRTQHLLEHSTSHLVFSLQQQPMSERYNHDSYPDPVSPKRLSGCQVWSSLPN